MQWILALLVLIVSLNVFCGGIHVMNVGKMIDVEVTKGEVRDADYFQRVLDDRNNGVVTIPVPKSVLESLIKYMRSHNLKLTPGNYRFHQGWEFKNGKFIQKLIIGQREIEVFKFDEID